MIIALPLLMQHTHDAVALNNIVNSNAFVRQLRMHDLVRTVDEFLLRDILRTDIGDQLRAFLPQNVDKAHFFQRLKKIRLRSNMLSTTIN